MSFFVPAWAAQIPNLVGKGTAALDVKPPDSTGPLKSDPPKPPLAIQSIQVFASKRPGRPKGSKNRQKT